MKILLSVAFIIVAGGAVLGQNGSLRGTISINKVSGNNLGPFDCSSLTVHASHLTKGSWSRSVAAKGKFSDRKCTFAILRVPAGQPFVVVVKADFPNGCDQKIFKTGSSFPMTVSSWQNMTFNPLIEQITCTIVK